MSGGGEHQLDGAQRFLLDALNAQMQRLLRENNEELYERVEGLENREHHEESGFILLGDTIEHMSIVK